MSFSGNNVPSMGDEVKRQEFEPLEIVLKVLDDFITRYNKNRENKLSAEALIQKLTDEPLWCYFQKHKNTEKSNRIRHKIIIPFDKERAVEFIVSLRLDKVDEFEMLHTYQPLKYKEVSFFKEPTKNTLKKYCQIIILSAEEKKGANASELKELYKEIEKLPIPVIDVNKEKDQQIWHEYIVALRKITRQKEHLWKISGVTRPYLGNEETGNRTMLIDFYISEEDLAGSLQDDIFTLFNENELADFNFGKEEAFFEFKNYRGQLSQQELSKLKEIVQNLFYELSEDSPIHSISGQISFKFSDDTYKSDVIDNINTKMLDGYELDDAITEDGHINLQEDQLSHLRKIIEDDYKHIISVTRDNIIQLKVAFKYEHEALNRLIHMVKRKLEQDGLTRNDVYLSKNGEYLIVEVPAYLPPNKFADDNLTFIKAVSRFAPTHPVELTTIPQLEIVNGAYHIINASKRDIDITNELLQLHHPLLTFVRKPTLYFYQLSDEASTNRLREFKTTTDVKGKSSFSMASSMLTITAEDQMDYQKQLERISATYPDCTIEQKPYKTSYSIQFISDIVDYRQGIMNRIKNELRVYLPRPVDLDILRNNTRALFIYNFKTEEEREQFKDTLNTLCDLHSDLLIVNFENGLGKTKYELKRNKLLELKKEKELISYIRQANFKFITLDQFEQLLENMERSVMDVRFRDGITIGTFHRKEGNKLTFKLDANFEKLLNERVSERIDVEEIKRGFINPTFPGELANIERMLRAMRKVTEPGYNGSPVNPNLSNFLFDPTEARVSDENLEEVIKTVKANLNEPLLARQPKQLEAVAKSLAAPDLALIQGPPGTGKTTVIAEIIWQILLQNPLAKILVTSQTNLAVDNALERLDGKKLVRPIRIGNTDKFEDEGKMYSNDRIKKWLNPDNELEWEANKDNVICDWINSVKDRSSDDTRFSKAITKWKAGLEKYDKDIKNSFGKFYYKYVNVFAATCSECGSRNFSKVYQETFTDDAENVDEPEFDVVIMDEASKATPPELVMPLTLGRKVIIIGDHKQLPPMINDVDFSEALESVGAAQLIEHWTREDYKVSQFEKLFKNAPKSIVASLDTQFRMHEQIMNCISQFYKNQEELEHGLICGIQRQMDIPDFNIKASRWHGFHALPFIDNNYHAIWVNVETPESKTLKSYDNSGEVNAILTILKILTKADGFNEYLKHFTRNEDREIGVITYYMAQMQKIKNAIYPHLKGPQWRAFDQHKLENEFQLPFRINTVDRFQGMERNIVIVSTVRSDKQIIEEKGKRIIVDNTNYPKALGFAKDLQRVNVGFSRAKRLLIIVGNKKHFAHKQEYAEALGKMHVIDIAQVQNLGSK